MGTNLTIKQEKFCQKYVELGNASDAYRQSYETKRMQASTVNRNAKALIDNNKIAARIKELQSEHRHRHDVTVDSATEELEAARKLAMDIQNPSAAIAASMGKAKLHGLLVDKKEITDRNQQQQTKIELTMTPEEAAAAYRQALKDCK